MSVVRFFCFLSVRFWGVGFCFKIHVSVRACAPMVDRRSDTFQTRFKSAPVLFFIPPTVLLPFPNPLCISSPSPRSRGQRDGRSPLAAASLAPRQEVGAAEASVSGGRSLVCRRGAVIGADPRVAASPMRGGLWVCRGGLSCVELWVSEDCCCSSVSVLCCSCSCCSVSVALPLRASFAWAPMSRPGKGGEIRGTLGLLVWCGVREVAKDEPSRSRPCPARPRHPAICLACRCLVHYLHLMWREVLAGSPCRRRASAFV